LALDDSAILDNPGAYRRLIGRLIYLTITRPDICYSVHILSQFMHQPRHGHWAAAIRVLRYLKSAPGQGIFLPSKSDLQLHVYCDSDWAGCPVTRRSLTGYFITLGCSPISWKTKKQTTVSRSSAEAEYRSMATTACEIIWLRTLLHDLMVPISSSAQLYCDNHAAIHIAANPVHHERTKHIEIDCHFIQDCIKLRSIATAHISSKLQLADLFTKALGSHQLSFLVGKLGIRNLHAPT